jgi:hypothetical protein
MEKVAQTYTIFLHFKDHPKICCKYRPCKVKIEKLIEEPTYLHKYLCSSIPEFLFVLKISPRKDETVPSSDVIE